jgi:hypothetical protein
MLARVPRAGGAQQFLGALGVLAVNLRTLRSLCALCVKLFHQSRSKSLIEVFARVRASTRLTITAQASPGRSAACGRMPGTTTEYGGTRP